ncbi:hypothetical protein [Acinetobacter baumannii]|uniref:hypothetical protein n=1 Tax=Acinetobacter baumannii TaxID=470 RepID=UPI003F4C2CBC
MVIVQELISENTRLKDAVLQADNATKAAEGKVVSIQAEFDAFKLDCGRPLQARIVELEAGKSAENPATETAAERF